MRRLILALTVLGLTAVGAALAYQAAARDRDYRALLAAGDDALKDDQTFGAIEAYSGAIALRPDSMLAHLRRGEAYQRRGELDAAARDFRMASALDPSATRPLDELADVLYQQQKFHRAAEIYERRLRLDERSAPVTYRWALALYRDRNLDSALAALASTIRLDDRMADAFYLQGICLQEKQRLSDAQQAFEKAVALSPGLIAAREELADIYGSLGKRADELEQLQVLAGLDREHVERQVAVGLAHARAGHPDLAVLTLGSALERTPDQPLIFGALGRIWLDIAESRNDGVALNKAVEALQRVVSGNTVTSELLTLYGRALLRSGDVDGAERALQQAIDSYPVDRTAFLFYASAAERQNHLAAARRALVAYGALVTDDPEFVSRAIRIAALSQKMNDHPTAIAWFVRASAANPDDARIAVLLADAQLRAGDRDGARATVTRGLDKDAKSAALLALARRLHM